MDNTKSKLKAKDKTKELVGMLEQNLEGIFQSGDFEKFLKLCNNKAFSKYSINNIILIMSQLPTAEYVAGYKTWENEFGRKVKPGEKAIYILAPSKYKKKVKIEKEDGTEEYLPDMVNVLCNDFAYNLITEFMQHSPAQWLAILLGEEHPAHEALKNLSRKYSGYFDFVDEDKYNARFRHIITGEIIEVTQKSLKGFPEDMKSDKTSLYAGFVRWQNEWWIMGLVNTYPKSEDLTEEIDKRAEEESHIFEEKTDLPENEQEIILKDILEDTDLGEGEMPLTPEETAWIAVLSDELGVSFMENAVQKGKVPELRFNGEKGYELLHDNLDFILRYIKR